MTSTCHVWLRYPSLHIVSRLALGLLMLFTLCSAMAEEPEPVYTIDIATSEAAEALKLLAQQTDAVVLFPYDIVEPFRTNKVYGRYTLTQALDLLLDGTKLSASIADNRVINVAVISNNASEKKQSQPEPADRGPDDTIISEELLITGSRIARSDSENPNPVFSLDNNTLSYSGALLLSDAMAEIPALTLGQSRFTGNFTLNQAGINALNLRGLGTGRTLVLVDSRRHVGADLEQSSAVDISSIPLALVERIEVITGGASAIYGADALAGAINFVMKDSYDGVQVDIQRGITSRDDGDEVRFSTTMGASFAEYRGNITLHASAISREPLLAKDRAFARAGAIYTEAENIGISDSPTRFVIARNATTLSNSTNAIVASTSIFANPGDNFFTFNNDLSLRPFEAGPNGVFNFDNVVDSELAVLQGGNENFYLATPDDRYLFDLAMHYDVRDDMQFFVETKYSQVEARSSFSSVSSIFELLTLDNPFIRDDLREIVSNAGAFGVFVNRSHAEFGNRETNNRRKTQRFLVGLSGTLAEQYDYEIYSQYGVVDTKNQIINDRNDVRWFQALDVIADPVSGQPVCRNPANGCVPINILGPTGTISQEAIDWVLVPLQTSTAKIQQLVVGADIRGTLDNLGFDAGAVKFAAGFEFREESRVNIPSQVVQEESVNDTRSALPSVDGRINVAELFAELAVPLLKDQTFAEELTVEAALRGSEFSTTGGALSYKLAAIWEPAKGFRLRSTFARSIRAPNINELFQPGSELGFISFASDPCDASQVNNGSANRFANCVASGVADPNNFNSTIAFNGAAYTISGNPDLDNELATTHTLGFVLQPVWMRGATFSTDYWQVDIEDYIEDTSRGLDAQIEQGILNSCVDSSSIDNAFCRLITRDATGNIVAYRAAPVNLSRFKTAGVDWAGRFSFELGSGLVDFSMTLTRNFKRQLFTGAELGSDASLFEGIGELGDPKWRALINLLYKRGPLAINLSSRYIGKQSFTLDNFTVTREQPVLDAVWYTDTQVSYAVNKLLTVYAGINDLFDEQLPIHPYTNPLSGAQFGTGILDPTGRNFYLRLRWQTAP